MPSILDDTALLNFLIEHAEKKFRIPQIHQALYKDLIDDLSAITTLPVSLRELLVKHFFLSSLETTHVLPSKKDNATKVILQTQDQHLIESVLMKHLKGRITACISSQIGCAMKCSFCATGSMGIKRDLHFTEIVDQVLFWERQLAKENLSVRNVVFMGMGEPLANYENVIQAIRILNDPKKLAKGARHITISTCGIIPGIERLITENIQVKLAISLHAPNDTLRSKLMPINNKYPLSELIQTLDHYTAMTNKRIFYEYIVLRDINDSKKEAAQLGTLLQGKLAHVNLIPWNTVSDSTYQASDIATMKRFQYILETYGIPSTIRVSLGTDIEAACGQLVKQHTK